MLFSDLLLSGTHAARPSAAGLGDGVIYAETDTAEIFQVQSGAWVSWYPAPSGSGTVTNVDTGTGLTGGPITASGTIELDDTAVTPDTYGDATHVPQITIDAQGRITAATDVAISGGGGSGTLGGAQAKRTTNQTISNNTETALSFDAENYDTDSYHDNSTNPTRLTVPATGIYLITGAIYWTSAINSATILLGIKKNASDWIAIQNQPETGAGNQGFVIATIASLTASDYVELRVHQSSGSSKDVTGNVTYSPIFTIERLR